MKVDVKFDFLFIICYICIFFVVSNCLKFLVFKVVVIMYRWNIDLVGFFMRE